MLVAWNEVKREQKCLEMRELSISNLFSNASTCEAEAAEGDEQRLKADNVSEHVEQDVDLSRGDGRKSGGEGEVNFTSGDAKDGSKNPEGDDAESFIKVGNRRDQSIVQHQNLLDVSTL